jgi:molybdopterin-guanine dinucleotide biosynthesis protein MobB
MDYFVLDYQWENIFYRCCIEGIMITGMNPTIIGFYGVSNTGKTTLIVNLIQRLTRDGFRIATIKKTDKSISIDKQGSDTWKHSQAGADLVVFSSEKETDFILKRSIDIDAILHHIVGFGLFDIIFIEGASDPRIPKIKVGKIKTRENTVMTYNGDINTVLEVVKLEFEKKQSTCELSIRVNNTKIPLNEFTRTIIENTIVGMLRSLKDVDIINDVEIKLTRT